MNTQTNEQNQNPAIAHIIAPKAFQFPTNGWPATSIPSQPGIHLPTGSEL
jgi:hypothetical protein